MNKLQKPLFDGVQSVSNELVIQKMQYFIERANKLMNYYENDKRMTVTLARELRNELKVEYKSNDLLRTRQAYRNHELFSSCYKPAVAGAYTKTTGQLTQRKAYSLLWDVDSYMNYYMPNEYKS